ncbi:MAG TPA: mechanosensitive ion channel family protein [Rhizobiaceae bacterium]|nr:mechanosensitive ion channel family protein [Rhizobiaceae bacterium]
MALQEASWAQDVPAELPPEKARQFLELLNDPEVKTWLEDKVAPRASERQAGDPFSDMLTRWEIAIRDRIGVLVHAVPRIPQELARVADIVSRDVNSGRPGLVALIVAVLIAVGCGAEWLMRRALPKPPAATKDGPDSAHSTILRELAILLTFSLASIGLFLTFEWPPLLRKTVLTLLVGIIIFRLVRAVLRPALVLAAAAPRTPPDASANGAAITFASDAKQPIMTNGAAVDFWFSRASLMAGIFLLGWAVASIMRSLGNSSEVTQLAAHLIGLALLAAAIDVVWRRPGQTTSALKGVLLTLFLVALWLFWVGGMPGLLWIGIYALVLPALLRTVGQLAQAFACSGRPVGAVGVIFDILVARGVRALVIAVAVAWLAYQWRFSAFALSGSELGERLVDGLFHAVIILVIADMAWQLSKALIDYRLKLAEEADGNGEQKARSGRLRTLLPIFRNVLLVFIAAVAVLTILSGLGIQILPLIAGAGILGVAIGFGSQTLVKDVLSGIFYMLDDAFRVGEYIQSGSYKGTVESFSLRSIRLRHHRGPVYTVPFGQLGAVQNMSRDWAIEKMTISVTHDSDVEAARKIIKKIGQELANDPEFAADTIEPLKMQGIDNFGEYSIVLRMKLMARPGTQFTMKRRAYMMIKKAFAENGIKIAFPTVHVEGGGDTVAAAQQVLKMQKAAAPASAEA